MGGGGGFEEIWAQFEHHETDMGVTRDRVLKASGRFYY